MNFAAKTVQNLTPISMSFASNLAMPVSNVYTVPVQTFLMDSPNGQQGVVGVTCSPQCFGVSSGFVNGQFTGEVRQGFAAALVLGNTQLQSNTPGTSQGSGSYNIGSNVSVYARETSIARVSYKADATLADAVISTQGGVSPLSAVGATSIAAYRAQLPANASTFSEAAGAYWHFTPPPPNTFLTGLHQAFGDAPTTALPSSGVATYAFVGGTTPTDNYGRAATYTGSSLVMNFGAQTVSNVTPISMAFAANSAMPVANSYAMPVQTWSMGFNVQSVNITCSGCVVQPTVKEVNGSFLGVSNQGYALVTNIYTPNLTQGKQNAAGNVSVFARP